MKCLPHYLLSYLLRNTLLVVSGFLLGFFFFHLSSTETFAQPAPFQDQVVSLINQERNKKNLPAYEKSGPLTTAALNHNKTMYNCSISHDFNSCFSHQVTIANEATLLSRISSAGYPAQAVAENIAWGQTGPADVVAAWMNSAGHKANILSESYKDVGCSLLDTANGNYKGMWWTCNFGRTSAVSSSPSPSIKPSVSPSVKPSSSPSVKPSASPSQKPSPSSRFRRGTSPAPLPSLSPSSEKQWWCKYIPGHRYCK